MPNASTNWRPNRYTWMTDQDPDFVSAFADGDAAHGAPSPFEHVRRVTGAFRVQGRAAGLRLARARGLEPGAGLYFDVRADSEERLAARLADLRSQMARARSPNGALAQQAAFVQARLEEVRSAVAKGQTPPPAIADHPEVPRREIPRWVPVVGLALSVLALVSSLGSSKGGK